MRPDLDKVQLRIGAKKMTRYGEGVLLHLRGTERGTYLELSR